MSNGTMDASSSWRPRVQPPPSVAQTSSRTSPSLSPPPSPPPSAPIATSSKLSKRSSETSDEPELIERPGNKARASNGTETDTQAGDGQDAERDEKRAAEAKSRHQADLALHAYEAPKADRPQDDWQVAYVWAFIVKFNQRDRIKRLECLEDFEQSLMEPVAQRPDDILEGTLIRFLSNLKPGSRNLDCTNIQHHLLNYINEQLLGPSEFTVWDRPWAPNEEARGSCCNSATNRTELGKLRYAGEPPAERVGRNPLVQAEKRGGGLFELDWRERVGLLRQMVDWQLTHCEPFRAIINKERGVPIPKNTTVPENQPKVGVDPVGMDRNKQRIWILDNSGRMYKSGNPFKRPCPIFALSSNKTEMQAQIDKWAEHGNSEKPALSGVKGKAKAEAVAMRKAIKGIEDEKKLAEEIGGLMEAVEKEDARIARARKKLADSAKIYMQAEFRSTRTRRTTKKIDYAYEDDSGEDGEAYDEPRRGSRRGEPSTSAIPSRPIIPGERKSARLTKDGGSVSYNEEWMNGEGDDDGDNDNGGAVSSPGEDEEEYGRRSSRGEARGPTKKRRIESDDEDDFSDDDGGAEDDEMYGNGVGDDGWGPGQMEGIEV